MTTPEEPLPTTPSAPEPVTDPQLRDLAAQLAAPMYSFDPSTLKKGIVSAVDLGNATTPPTISATISGDAATIVPNIRVAADYSPQIGDTVILLKQGAEMFAICAIAATGSKVADSSNNGWTVASLGSGKSHDGNGNGDLQYRRILEHGEWKMQWKGSINYSSGTSLLASALASEFRPTQKRSVVTARTADFQVVVGLDFNTDGTVVLVGPTEGTHTHAISITDNAHDHTFSDSSSSTSTAGSHGHAGPAHLHTHGGAVAATSFVESVPATSGHAHTVAVSGTTSGTAVTITGDTGNTSAPNPTWVSFHGIEYFL